MSKRVSTGSNPANAPVAKKSRIDVDGTATEVKTMNSQLIDALKAQKAAVQWGHTTCREDTMGSIAKAESMMSSVEKLEKKSKDASSAVEKLIDALIESEINTVTKALEKNSVVDEDYDMPETRVLDAMRHYNWSIKHTVKKQLKEKMENLTVDEVIKRVQAEAKSAYKVAAKKTFANIIEEVLP